MVGTAIRTQIATLESVRFSWPAPVVKDGKVIWVLTPSTKAPIVIPQICWRNGSTWGEANVWALELASSKLNPKTVQRYLSHVHSYAKWLEEEGIDWWHFPSRASERCLTRFRGAIVRQRDAGELKPSTASHRMSAVIRFYRWLMLKGMLSTDWPMWSERIVGIKLTDRFGLDHTLRVATTDLAIPNRTAAGAFPLEDGLLPVTREARREILALADVTCSEELALMLRLGFLSGMRLGSITDLKVETLLNASRDPLVGWHRLSLGPRARPVVATKYSVSGMVPIPADLLEQLIQYATSTRRLKREALADHVHKRLLFLTRFGKPYGGNSRAVNVEIMRLRRAGKAAGIYVLNDFHFHRSRATFATELMRVALDCLPVSDAISFVREACLHKREKTTLEYVRFIGASKAMAEAADAFTEAFMGLARGREKACG